MKNELIIVQARVTEAFTDAWKARFRLFKHVHAGLLGGGDVSGIQRNGWESASFGGKLSRNVLRVCLKMFLSRKGMKR